jgi:tripartite-type tricarboxylate transporter receptor subunit TctC
MMVVGRVIVGRVGLPLCFAALVTMALASPDFALAQTDEPFYRGKTIAIISPADPGGSYDLYARLMANHLRRHIPGEPAIIVQNMTGAGGLRALNYMASVARRDGTYLQVPVQDVALSEVLGREGVKYKAGAFSWIGRIAPSIDLTVTWHTSKVRTIEDARTHEVTLAATGPNSPTSVNPAVLNALVGTKFRIIQGYKSNAQMSAAMERGETDGAFVTWTTLKSSFPHWITEGRLNKLVVYNTKRISELPDVPAMTELGKTQADRQILALLSSTGVLGRSLITTEDVPADRVATLRMAFDKMVADPEFLIDVKRFQIEFEPMGGVELQQAISSMVDAPPDVLTKARTVIHGAMKR